MDRHPQGRRRWPQSAWAHHAGPLELPGYGYDFDPCGTQQLLTSRDEGVWRRSHGEITGIPDISGALLAVW